MELIKNIVTVLQYHCDPSGAAAPMLKPSDLNSII